MFLVVFCFSILNWQLMKIILESVLPMMSIGEQSVCPYLDEEIRSFFIFSPAVFVRRRSERAAGWVCGSKPTDHKAILFTHFQM